MSQSFYIGDALNVANRGMSRPIEDDHASTVANMATSYIWMKYDWRESLSELPPFWVVPLKQDYGAPFYGVPGDFHGLRLAYIVQMTGNPPFRREIKIVKNLRREFVKGFPTDICYVPEKKSFRLFPCPAANLSSTEFLIDGTYKVRAPQVDNSTLMSTLVPWDDMYFQHYVAALRWVAASLADNPAAANKKLELDALLMEMANTEGLELGNQVIAPSEPLVGGSGDSFPGSFIFF